MEDKRITELRKEIEVHRTKMNYYYDKMNEMEDFALKHEDLIEALTTQIYCIINNKENIRSELMEKITVAHNLNMEIAKLKEKLNES